jgi:hypothetical protein
VPKQLAEVAQISFANAWDDEAEQRPGMGKQEALAPIRNIQAAIPFVVRDAHHLALATQNSRRRAEECLHFLCDAKDHRIRDAQAA